ncbi:MAG: YscO family type III secretion system apparatus protein, partial [Verrucomicrobia bacterium]|nr:YscO family type III secretion system apparatus protein [Verrucomicrobiota bacterium]
ELIAARRAVASAQEALEARENELKAFNETKEERRDRIYAAIMGQPVSRDRIDMAQEGVARIDEEGALKADNVAQAKNDLKRREEAAEAARELFVRWERTAADPPKFPCRRSSF